MAGLDPAIHLTSGNAAGLRLHSGNRQKRYALYRRNDDLSLRVYHHKLGRASEFTRRYGVSKLVWYEEYPTVPQAIQRETSLKRWKREWKIALIEEVNPGWEDLSAGLV